jgi:hypothetical protein
VEFQQTMATMTRLGPQARHCRAARSLPAIAARSVASSAGKITLSARSAKFGPEASGCPRSVLQATGGAASIMSGRAAAVALADRMPTRGLRAWSVMICLRLAHSANAATGMSPGRPWASPRPTPPRYLLMSAPAERCSSGLVSLKEKIDTNSAAGERLFHMFGAISHFERRLTVERTEDGIVPARAKGKRPERQPLDRDRITAAPKLVSAGLPATDTALQRALGRSTVYREMSQVGLRHPGPVLPSRRESKLTLGDLDA